MKMTKNCFAAIAFVLIAALALSCASTGGGGKAKLPVGKWNFSDPELGTQGWHLATSEFYQYRGKAELSRDDTTLGKGLLRLDLDFTNELYSKSEWSEPKMMNEFPRAFNMKGITRFAFDFYYNPSFDTQGGSFKAKVFSSSNGIKVDFTGEAIEGTEDAGNGFKKAAVEILIMPNPGFMTDMRFSIAGYLTNYKGPVFFDNMRWE